jgi:hypothetical protein
LPHAEPTPRSGADGALVHALRSLHDGLLVDTLLINQHFHFKTTTTRSSAISPNSSQPAERDSGNDEPRDQLKDTGFNFRRTYQPTMSVVDLSTDQYYPREIVDFEPDGAYAPYNWELFYHAPLLIANSLSQNQRFEEARDWYHFIFNPIGVEPPVPADRNEQKLDYKPFFETTTAQYIQQRIDNIC